MNRLSIIIHSAFLLLVGNLVAASKEITLTSEIQAPIMADGHQIGSVKLPVGSSVMIVSVANDGVMVNRGGGTPFKIAREAVAPEALAAAMATPAPLVLAPVETPKPAATATPVSTAIFPPVPLSQREWDAGPISGAALDTTQFRWWSPPGVKNLRAVIVLVNGRNMDGRGFTDDRNWQQLATEMQLGLVGCNFFGGKDHATYQFDPSGDLDRKINEAVEKLAVLNGHPELQSPPLIFWGHSAGANVNQAYAKRFPNRVLAVINLKGPDGPGDTTPAKNAVPFLIITGMKDKPDWVKSSTENFEIGHKAHALWTQALSPNEGHESGKSHDLVMTFLRSVITQRLGPVSATPTAFYTPSEPKRLSSSDGWLGNPKSYDIASETNYPGSKSEAIWLPDEATAKAWQVFLRGQ